MEVDITATTTLVPLELPAEQVDLAQLGNTAMVKISVFTTITSVPPTRIVPRDGVVTMDSALRTLLPHVRSTMIADPDIIVTMAFALLVSPAEPPDVEMANTATPRISVSTTITFALQTVIVQEDIIVTMVFVQSPLHATIARRQSRRRQLAPLPSAPARRRHPALRLPRHAPPRQPHLATLA